MALSSLKVLQHNVMAWTFNRRNELYNTYQNEDPDIILINSHGRKNEDKIKIFNYTVYQRNYLGEAHDGVAIAIKKNIQHKIIDNLDENYLAITVTTTLGPICIGTGYQPPRRHRIPIHNIINIMRRNMPAYFLGDLNAKHRAFNHQENNASGRLLYNLVREGNLIHLGPDFQTYVTRTGSGTPDIVLSNNRQMHNLQIKPGCLTTSDHLPIITLISASPIQVPAQPRFNLKKGNWEAFQAELQTVPNIQIEGQPSEEINRQMNKWFNTITNAMNKHIPKTQYRTLPHPRTTDEIRNIQIQYNTLQQHAHREGWTRQHRQRLTELQQHLQEICKREREAHWNSLLVETEADYRDPAKFWQRIRKMLGGCPRHIPYVQDEHGKKLHTDKEQEAEFRRFWSKIYHISDEDNRDFCHDTQVVVEDYLRQHEINFTPYENIDQTRLSEDNPLIKPITLQEIKSTIKKFKNKKAPGISLINKEIIMHLPDNMLSNLKTILNASLSTGLFPKKFKIAILKFIPKGNKTPIHVQNHRPISLLEAAAKIYEKIINNRLRIFQETNNQLNPKQHSYRTKRGTHTAIALLYEEIAISQQNKEQCNIVLRDVSKAFDKIYHAGLKYKILQLHLPRCITALLCNFLDDRTARIQIGQFTGEEFPLRSGVPQGSCLSPTLYNLYVADLGELRRGTYIQYADDIIQCVRYPGHSKEMCKRKTEAAIEEVNDYEKRWKIKTNTSKFQILHASKSKPRHIKQQGNEVPFARQARILGLKLNRTGIQPHIKERRQLAQLALTKIKRFSGMCSRTKLHLYKAMVAPHLTYPPVPLNIMSNTNTLKLQALQNKALRWINGDTPPYNTTAEDLHHRYKLQPINTRIFTAAKKVWNTLRENQGEEIERLLAEEIRSSHSWWRRAYISEDDPTPAPLYSAATPRQEAGIDSEDEEERI